MARRLSLTPPQLAAVSAAALQNSKELLADAETLLASGSYARAQALGTLAAEEFGKHIMCASVITRSAIDTNYDWRRFWRRFANHEAKLRMILMLAQAMLPRDARDPLGYWSWARLEHTEKLRRLYVDIDDKGNVASPNDVDPEDARVVIALVRYVVDLLGDRSDPERLLESGLAVASDQEMADVIAALVNQPTTGTDTPQ